jgi:hypothetical protein
MILAKKLGLAGTGTSLVVAGALLCGGGSAGAAALDQDGTSRAVAASAAVPLGPTVNVVPNTNSFNSVQCPAGTTAVGGGLITTGIRMFVTDSLKSGNGWAIRVTNTGNVTESFRVEAICI